MRQPVLLSPKFGAKSLDIFPQSPQNVTAVCRTDCLACQDKFFVNNPLNGKENYERVFDFAFHVSRLFLASVSSDFSIGTIVALSQDELSSPGQEGSIIGGDLMKLLLLLILITSESWA
jgi:hypothetical protein